MRPSLIAPEQLPFFLMESSLSLPFPNQEFSRAITLRGCDVSVENAPPGGLVKQH